MTLPFPIQFASNGPQWAQGFDAWYDYTKPQGSQLLAFPPATDTHSATVYAQSSSGVWQAIPANVPSRTDLGLQTVPTRTNSIRNNSMVGAVAGVIGSGGALPTNWQRDIDAGLTYTIATGTAFGLPYIDIRFAGTTATTFTNIIFESNTQTVAANGETWTSSWFYTLVGGSLANITSVANGTVERTSTGVYVAGGIDQTVTPTAAFQRAAAPRTLSGGATVARVNSLVGLRYSSGVAIDITLRIYAPQMELGAFASAPILTTSGAATVNGNQQVVDLTGRLSAGVGGIVQFQYLNSDGALPRVLEFNDGTTSNNVRIQLSSLTPNILVTSGGADTMMVSAGTALTAGTTYTLAFAASSNYAQIRLVGSALPTPALGGAFSSALTRFCPLGRGFDVARNAYGNSRRIALKFGAQSDATFADLFSKATILNAVS